jgi:hypothetical protein
VLSNNRVRLVTLTGGGHIAEFRFTNVSGLPTVNPLWVPPWKTIDPFRYRARIHEKIYGTLDEGKLLSGIAGHSLCLDSFGPPSHEEFLAGLSFHGEAPSLKWKVAAGRATSRRAAVRFDVRLPEAGLKFSRTIELRHGESVAYFTETVENERKLDHFFHWQQHVTIGPPFLSHGTCAIGLPATRGLTWPHGYEGKECLHSSRPFHWPLAPARRGGLLDLRHPLQRPRTGLVATVLLDPNKEIGYIAALNSEYGILLGYCFRREDFPWTAIWEENRALTGPPWKGRTRALGLEFGTTAFPVGRREAFIQPELWRTPTHALVPARSRKTVRYLAFLSTVPAAFGEVRDLRLTAREIVVLGSGRGASIRLIAAGAGAVLR